MTVIPGGILLPPFPTGVAAGAVAGTGGGVYGDGSDGTVVFDGVATVLGIVPSTNVYTLARNIYCRGITINSGVTVRPNGFQICCQTPIVNNGTINGNGSNSGGSGSAPTTGSHYYGGGGGGGAGGGLSAAGSPGSNVSVAMGGGTGGAGGANAGSAQAGGAGGVQTSVPNDGTLRANPPAGIVGAFFLAVAIQGGAGGGGGAGGATGASGGGGSGGEVVYVAAPGFSGTGTISANGGNGVTGSLASGGGGGGGGGVVIIVTAPGAIVGGAIPGQTITANGGIGAASSGTGLTGVSGQNGTVSLLS